MNSLSIASPFYTPFYPSKNEGFPFKTQTRKAMNTTVIRASSSMSPNSSPPPMNPLVYHLKAAACTAVFAAATLWSFPYLRARAEPNISPMPSQTETLIEELKGNPREEEVKDDDSPLAHLLETNSEATEALKKLLQEKLEAGEDEESLSILKNLVSSQPDNLEWRFLMARVLSELGKIDEARGAYEEILSKQPLSFEALFENALLMDRSGERELVMGRLEDALRVAEDEIKMKEARDVKLIMAQMRFLHKDVDEALRSYDDLVKEDPRDFRPYFCKGMIYSLMDKNVEAREMFKKYRELSPKKFEVEGYLRSPLSKMKLFGTGEEN